MHVHNDHGTGGHWCAKVVFFILLAGLGALIGLIMFENRDLSNSDTPLSESRYAEYLEGWVDENREDDHHHEEILEALNQLDDHDDEDDEAHGDEDHDEEDDEDDGAPYAEEEDHDDERELEDDEDEGELPKLDDDEVEEIVATEKKVAKQEAQAAADNDDGMLKSFKQLAQNHSTLNLLRKTMRDELEAPKFAGLLWSFFFVTAIVSN